VYDYGETDMDGEGRTAYLVMELVNGEPLNSVLKRTGRLSLRHALDMLEQTGRALQVAHTAALCTATSSRATSSSRRPAGEAHRLRHRQGRRRRARSPRPAW
jgi:serine/threonine protein kinase